jgi:hypothetical protein
MEAGTAGQSGECVGVGSGHPGLAAETEDFIEQGGPTRGVEMGCDFIEKQDRAHAVAAGGDEFGMGED